MTGVWAGAQRLSASGEANFFVGDIGLRLLGAAKAEILQADDDVNYLLAFPIAAVNSLLYGPARL
ncbi:hypothetical protein C7G41_32515 [Bradyrhizobium sp. MOS002]|nr:hypothetical protein C7G41_32515 [Bradyrhizobium sp. MOS002]